jgi:hypothetical protein
MNVALIDPLTDPRWDSFVLAHPEGSIFHHSSWMRVLGDRYHCDPFCFVAEDAEGRITAGVPFVRIMSRATGKRLVCLPASDHCFPLASSSDDLKAVLQPAMDSLKSDGVSYMEIRGWGSCPPPQELGISENSYYLAHVLDLDQDLEKLKSRMTRNGRYNLRYAQKTPVTVRQAQDERDLKSLKRVSDETRRRLGLLPIPFRFFESIYRHVIAKGLGYISLAELNGTVVAANLYFCFKDTITHEIATQDRRFFEYRPNYLLIWDAIERACQGSYRHYDFGYTHPESKALADFKRNWGSKETPLPYYYYPSVRGIKALHQNSAKYRVYNLTCRRAPGAVVEMACNVLYRHMG